MATGHAAARATSLHTPGWVCVHTGQCIPRWVRERGRDSLLESMGYMAAKATWPIEKTGKHTVLVQVTSKSESQAGEGKTLFVPLGLY